MIQKIWRGFIIRKKKKNGLGECGLGKYFLNKIQIKPGNRDNEFKIFPLVSDLDLELLSQTPRN